MIARTTYALYVIFMGAVCITAFVLIRDASRLRKHKAEEQSPASIIVDVHRKMAFEGRNK